MAVGVLTGDHINWVFYKDMYGSNNEVTVLSRGP